MKSMELAEHATKVMTNLDEMINSLDDMDYFFRHLHSLGKYHRRIPGFHKDNFLVCHFHFVFFSIFEYTRSTLEIDVNVRFDPFLKNIMNIIKRWS